MKNPRARTKLACKIAVLNPDRFNEAVASGAYPCAPNERDGTSRIFTVNDIIALRVYSRLTDEGMIAKKAGPLACGLSALLSEYPDCDRAVHVVTSVGSSVWMHRDHITHDAEVQGGSDIVSTRDWRFETLRKRIVHEIEDALGIAGDE